MQIFKRVGECSEAALDQKGTQAEFNARRHLQRFRPIMLLVNPVAVAVLPNEVFHLCITELRHAIRQIADTIHTTLDLYTESDLAEMQAA